MNEVWITYQPHDGDPMFLGPSFNSLAFPGHALDVVVHESITFVPFEFAGSPPATRDVPAPGAAALLLVVASLVALRRSRQ